MCNDKKDLALISSIELTLSFPSPHEIIENEGKKTRESLKKTSLYAPATGQVYLDTKALPQILATDKAGVNKYYNELDNDDKYETGNKKLVSLPAVQKEISERITEPRDTIQIERLKDSEQCLITLRDAPEIVKERELQESKNRRDFSKLRDSVIEENNITHDECTGEPLKPSPQAHHIERRADNPRKTLDPNNIAIINRDTHHDIHDKKIHDAEALLDYSKKNGGALGNRIKKNLILN